MLTAYGVEQSAAVGYTLVLHVALWLPITLLGAYFMTREGIKWDDSLRQETQDDKGQQESSTPPGAVEESK